MGRQAEHVLGGMLETRVEIGRVEIGLFNRMMLHDVCIFDRSGRPMLEGRLMSAKVEVMPLVHGEVSLRTVSFIDTQARLRKDKIDGEENFRFVLDAFKSQKKGPSKLNLRINSIILRRVAISYDEAFQPKTAGSFNTGHLALSDIDANISLKRLTPDSIALRVRHVAFKEQCGLDVRSLSLRIAAGKHGGELTRFRLELPNSLISEDRLALRYDAGERKNFFQTIQAKGSLRDITLCTEDIAGFVSPLHKIRKQYHLSCNYSLQNGEINVDGLTLYDNDGGTTMRADASAIWKEGKIADGRLQLKRLFISAKENATIARDLLGYNDSSALMQIGSISLTGNARYVRNGRSRAQFDLRTDVGELAVTAEEFKKRVFLQAYAKGCSPARLFGKATLPEQISFHIDGKADLSAEKHPYASATLKFEDFEFGSSILHGLQANAEWHNEILKANIISANKQLNFTASAESKFSGHSFSDIRLQADIAEFCPAALQIASHFGKDCFSGRVQAAVSSPELSAEHAELHIKEMKRRTPEGENIYSLDHLDLTVSPGDNGQRIELDSDFARADIDGTFTIDFFNTWLNHLLAQTIPSEEADAPKGSKSQSKHPQEDLRFVIQLRKTDFLNEMLGIPLTLDGPLTAEGYVGMGNKRSSVVISNAGFSFKGISAKNMRFYATGNEGNVSALLQAQKRIGKTDIKMDLKSWTKDGTLRTDLRWDDGKQHRYGGILSLSTTSRKTDNGTTEYSTEVLPTLYSLGDTIWHIHGGNLTLSPAGIHIGNFHTSHADQSIRIDGRSSRSATDSIFIDLQKVDLKYILGMANIRPVSFAGEVNGRLHVAPDETRNTQIAGRLDIPDFVFNDAHLGHALIDAAFNLKDTRLHLVADIQEKNIGRTFVEGYVGIGEKALDLNISNRNMPLIFLRRYLSGLFGNIDGRSSGKCRIYGSFKNIDFEGEQQASVEADVLSTGVRYRVEGGTVRLDEGIIRFDDFNLSDSQGGTGKMSGEVTHRHLKNVCYDFSATTNHLKIYDKKHSDDMPFQATVYGNASAHLFGRPGALFLDLNMSPTTGTNFTYIIDTPETFGDVSLLRFANADSIRLAALAETGTDSVRKGNYRATHPSTASSTDITLNFRVAMTPEAALRVIMDERTGDNILLRGNGELSAAYYNKTGFEMYGIYNVENGLYKMSIQDLIRKDFNFSPGGSITFAGNPFDADLKLKAIYTVPSASLADLGLGINVGSGTVRADCELNFSGKVKSPQVKFNLGLPTVSDEVKHMVNRLIANEEDMNTQVLYLLGVGRFYPLNHAGTESMAEGQSQSMVAMKSFLSSTLSSQLNNILFGAMNNSNWTFGTNLSTGSVGWSDMEVEGLLSGRLLNNRLLINGNFGYRERATSSSNFIGDFDISYLLTPAGGVRLKAYSETNDRYFSKSSMTTQGVGVQFHREFNGLRDLFRPRRKKSKTN